MPKAACFACALLVAGLGPFVLGAEPTDRPLLFGGSDLAQLDQGFAVPVSGTYTVKAWTAGKVGWSIEAADNVLTLTPRPEKEVLAPRWLVVGQVELKVENSARLLVKSADSGADPGRPPVPTFLSFSTDPSFEASRSLDLVRGSLNTVGPTLDARRLKVRTNQEGADFEPPASPQDWRDRSRVVREQLLVTLGLWPMPPKTDLNARVYGTLERDGYAIDKVVLETLPGFYLAGNLYRPTNLPMGQSPRRPVVLCPHGHWEEGRVQEDVQARCIRLAQLGCVVFVYDMVGFADGKPFGHAFLDARLKRWGLSLVTLQTWNSIRSLDWLLARGDVDPARAGITGESGGATQTLLLTAIDQRVKVSAPVVMVSDGFQGGCVCENAAGLRWGTDNIEFAALAAPRAMKVVGATGDWTARTMTNAFPSLQMVYAQAGASDRVEAEVFDFPHNYNQTSRNAVYAFLGRRLIGIDDPSLTVEGKLTIEKPSDLYAFDSAHPYPSDARTPDQLERALVEVMGRQLDRLAPGVVDASWEASRDRLATAHKVRVGLQHPPTRETTARDVRKLKRDGLTIAHITVGRRSRGELIPVVKITPAQPSGRLTIVSTPRGKLDLATSTGEPSPMVQALLDRGQTVVGFDPLLVGESFDPSLPATRRPSVFAFDTYNPSLAGDRAQDLSTVLSWSQALPGIREVNLVATGQAGPLALLARPLLEGLARTMVDLDEFDYGDGSKPVPIGLDLPGVLQFGGLEAAAALSSPTPLWITRPGVAFDVNWPIRAYALSDASGQLRVDRKSAEVAAIARWLDEGN